jgi:hypothetical protein
MVCHRVPPTLREEIARMPAEPPVEPEMRIGREIRALALMLEDGGLSPVHRRHVERRLAMLEAELGIWIATKYRPNPKQKGGR